MALGFVLLGISFLPFEFAKVKIDALAPNQNAEFFTASFFERMVLWSRFMGVTLFFFSCILCISKRWAQHYISEILISFSSFLGELTQRFNQIVRKEDRIHLYALFIILLLGIAVRLCFLYQPIRYDEAATFLYYASQPLYTGLSNWSAPNNHIFHTFLVHLAYFFLGNRTWVIRLPALFAGILLIPASYTVIRIFYNKYAALLTAGVVASSSALVEYSTNARGYTLLCLIFLLILGLGKYLTQRRNSAVWFLFVILSVLGFYTIPIMLYPFGIVIIWLLLSIIFRDTKLPCRFLLKRLFCSLIIVALLTFVVYVPVFAMKGFRSVIATSQSWSYFTAEFAPFFSSIWNQWNRDIPTVISFLFIIGFFVSLVFHKQLTNNHGVPIILAVVIWLVPILILRRVPPFRRIWLFLLPLYIGISSSGVSYLLRLTESKIDNYKSIVSASLAIILSFWLSLNVVYTRSVYYSNETGTLRDAEAITTFLKNYLEPEDRVLAVQPSDAPLRYYFDVYQVSSKYLSSDLDSSHRILVLVNESHHQTLRGILDKAGLLKTSLSVPQVIQRYESATLYDVRNEQIKIEE